MKEEIQETVGRRIRNARIARGIKQCELAFMAGVGKTYMCEIEAGKKNITVSMLVRIARCLEVSPGDFLEGL